MGGASGVGSAAIQIAKHLGARVISTGSTPAKRDLAIRLGAELALDTADPRWIADIRKVTEKRGVDLVVEHVGGPILERIFGCLARGGTIVTCGATAGAKVNLDLWPLFVKQQQIIGSYGRDSRDLKATLDWAGAGDLKAVIDSQLPLERTPEAFTRLRSRQMLGKLIIVPGLG
jgi:NADPH:quinone reductase-like Zn-dependent oxidoreductase